MIEAVIDRVRFRLAVEKASDEFWKSIADSFPEITSGDFGIHDTRRWNSNCKDAVTAWLILNGDRS